jgi:hypothetical protein
MLGSGFPPLERRAFIIGSYQLKDEGEHWRRHIRSEPSPLEIVVKEWIERKVATKEWKLPL